jgi:hypothetical protein
MYITCIIYIETLISALHLSEAGAHDIMISKYIIIHAIRHSISSSITRAVDCDCKWVHSEREVERTPTPPTFRRAVRMK